MNEIFFTSDTHLGHDIIRKYCQRPFETCEEMDETIIDNWNRVVGQGDLIYHLGDFAFGGHDIVRRYRSRLNGNIILILGNHDWRNKIRNVTGCFKSIYDLLVIQYEKHCIVLCHYAMRVWPQSHFNSYQFYGHSHGTLQPQGKQMDVGVDCNGYTPIHADKIMRIMLMKSDNFNLIKDRKNNHGI
jgi:calcineurin-like phosphoesterase family protein